MLRLEKRELLAGERAVFEIRGQPIGAAGDVAELEAERRERGMGRGPEERVEVGGPVGKFLAGLSEGVDDVGGDGVECVDGAAHPSLGLSGFWLLHGGACDNVRMRRIVVLLVLAITAVGGERKPAEHVPKPVTICELTRNASSYESVRVQVTGMASRSFENFTISDAGCPNNTGYGVWLEYGGKLSSESIFCCPGAGGVKVRSTPLTINGIETVIVKNRQFDRFRRLVHRKPSGAATATLIGRFFSLQKKPDGGTEGYGHFGLNHLPVIERVVDVAPLEKR